MKMVKTSSWVLNFTGESEVNSSLIFNAVASEEEWEVEKEAEKIIKQASYWEKREQSKKPCHLELTEDTHMQKYNAKICMCIIQRAGQWQWNKSRTGDIAQLLHYRFNFQYHYHNQ